jgi:hypothetical protein
MSGALSSMHEYRHLDDIHSRSPRRTSGAAIESVSTPLLPSRYVVQRDRVHNQANNRAENDGSEQPVSRLVSHCRNMRRAPPKFHPVCRWLDFPTRSFVASAFAWLPT